MERRKVNLVLIGDVRGSRRIGKRDAFQRYFESAITEMNVKYGGLFLSPATITLGDEFQAVLKRTDQLFHLLHGLSLKLMKFGPDIGIRYALGWGSIETAINPERAIGMDGTAFHYARQGIESAKAEKRELYFSGDLPESGIINDLLQFVDITRQSWSLNRLTIVHYYREGKTQMEIRKQIGISQSAISQNLNMRETRAVLQAEQTLEQYLTRLLEQ